MSAALSRGSDSMDSVYNTDRKIITAPLHHECRRRRDYPELTDDVCSYVTVYLLLHRRQRALC